MSSPFIHVRPGQKVDRSAVRENMVSNMLRNHQQQRLIAPPSARVGGGAGGDTMVPVKITSVISGEFGRYNAKSIKETTNKAASGALVEADLGTVAENEDTIVWNLGEIGTEKHSIPIGAIVWGERIGTDTDTGYRIIELPYYKTADVAVPTAIRQVMQCTAYTDATNYVTNYDYIRSHS